MFTRVALIVKEAILWIIFLINDYTFFSRGMGMV